MFGCYLNSRTCEDYEASSAGITFHDSSAIFYIIVADEFNELGVHDVIALYINKKLYV